MEPIILKVYNKLDEEIGSLFIKGKELPTGEITYSIAYIPEGRSWNAYRDAVATYQNSIDCMMDMKKKGFYLNKEDWDTFTRITTDEYIKIVNSLRITESAEEKLITCSVCDKDIKLDVGFFRIEKVNYCCECYREHFQCKVSETSQEEADKKQCCKCGGEIIHFFHPEEEKFYCEKCFDKYLSMDKEEEENPQSATGTCYKCNKTYPLNKMNLNPLAGGWQCHNCFYEIEEEKDNRKIKCNGCGEEEHPMKMYFTEDKSKVLCHSCYYGTILSNAEVEQKYYKEIDKCSTCKKEFTNADLLHCKKNKYCPDCFDNMSEEDFLTGKQEEGHAKI